MASFSPFNIDMQILRKRAFRWGLLMIGLLAIIALTGMNVLSLYDLRERMVESEEERRVDQLDEINDSVRNQILDPLRGLYKIELEPVEDTFQLTGQFTENFEEVLYRSSLSPYFKEIYFTPEGADPCDSNDAVYKYNADSHRISPINDYPQLICDGVGLVRTKTKIQLNDFNYRWNNNWEFDTHRSLNVGLINLSESRMIGYLTLTLNEDYIINEIFPPLLKNYFSDSQESGIAVWIRDWTNGEILATNDTSVTYDRDIVDHRMGFSGSGFFDNWSLNIAFLHSAISNTYNATFTKNLFVLGVAVLFLMGALIFMFVTAQRERHLAQRQASFLANVTHELKTPLAVMQAAGENISDGRVTEPKRLKQYGSHIYNESIRLRGMIEKLLDVARTDSGQIMLKAAPYHLQDLMHSFLNENREFIENKGFEIEYKPSEVHSLVMIDPNSFDTIMNNLTENAIKYSRDDKFIKYQISEDDESVFVSVTDHGIGIPKKVQKNIFKKFYRVEGSDSTSSKVKGHGLGLSIVKNMVELNNGDIQVKSSPDKGATFIVRFPKFKGHKQPEDKTPETKTHLSIKKKQTYKTEYAG